MQSFVKYLTNVILILRQITISGDILVFKVNQEISYTELE